MIISLTSALFCHVSMCLVLGVEVLSQDLSEISLCDICLVLSFQLVLLLPYFHLTMYVQMYFI